MLSSQQVQLPSNEISVFLLDTYFNSAQTLHELLFHKATFFADFNAGKVSQHVVLSIFALSSV